MKKKAGFPWGLITTVVALTAGLAVGIGVGASAPKSQCAEIVVTGTPGVSTMAVDKNDLYLTGVTGVKCGEFVPPAPHPLGF